MAYWQSLYTVIPFTTDSNLIEDNFEKLWSNVEINFHQLCMKIDLIVDCSDCGDKTYFAWKNVGVNKPDNDVDIVIDLHSKKIKYFQFRIDVLRDKSLIFLGNMISICNSFNFLIIDKDKIVVNNLPNTCKQFEEI